MGRAGMCVCAWVLEIKRQLCNKQHFHLMMTVVSQRFRSQGIVTSKTESTRSILRRYYILPVFGQITAMPYQNAATSNNTL